MADSDLLRRKWRKALALLEERYTDTRDAAEQKAWDEFRDACEDEYPRGTCPHPECPQTPLFLEEDR